MTTPRKSDKEDFRSFEYVLNDFLELKAEVDPKRAEPLRDYLLSREKEDLTLSAVEGFRLNGHLVLIADKSPRELTRLVLFNPEDGSIRIKEITI